MMAAWIDAARLSGRTGVYPGKASDGFAKIEVDAATVRVRVVGKRGPTLVVSPDPPNVIEHYADMLSMFRSLCRVVCIELPGFGFSLPKGGYRFSLGETAAALIQVLEELALGPYVMALPCVAGYVSLEIASRRPELVSGLVTIQTPSYAEELRWAERVDYKGLIATPYFGQALVAIAAKRITRSWYRAALANRDHAAEYSAEALRALDLGANFCLASAFQALRWGPAPRAGERASAHPALCVWGTRDRTHRRTRRDSILEIAPGARLAEIPQAGHFPELEQPARFRDLVADFLVRDV